MKRAAFVLAMLAAPAAMAQGGPSFDCARASTAVERTICKMPELARADRALSDAYVALLGRLGGPAREHLQKDQQRWVAKRDRACTASAFLGIEDCLKGLYGNRLQALAFMSGGPYPFVSEQILSRTGKVGATPYHINASYPQFDAASPDFAATNRFFLEGARARAADAVPPAGEGENPWSYDQSFSLERPVPTAVSVEVTYYIFTGGAHGSGATAAALVDLQTGRIVRPAEAFGPGNEWRGVLRELAIADLRKQFVERPGYDDALEPKAIDKILGEARRYAWRAGKLVLVFDQDELAAHVMGPYEVEIPYGRIKALLRPDGPLAALR